MVRLDRAEALALRWLRGFTATALLTVDPHEALLDVEVEEAHVERLRDPGAGADQERRDRAIERGACVEVRLGLVSTRATISSIQRRTNGSSTRASGVAPKLGRSRLRPVCLEVLSRARRHVRPPLLEQPQPERLERFAGDLISPGSIDSTRRRRAVTAARRLVNPRRVESFPSDCRPGSRRLDLSPERLIEHVRLLPRGEPPRALPALLTPPRPPPLLARIEVDTHDTPPRGHTSVAPMPRRDVTRKWPPSQRRPRNDESPANAGLSRVRRRGLEPPPGYPGPGPQPGASTNSAIGARATASIDRLRGSAGVAHARGDAVDGEEARPRQRLAVAVTGRPGAAQELDLEQ